MTGVPVVNAGSSGLKVRVLQPDACRAAREDAEIARQVRAVLG